MGLFDGPVMSFAEKFCAYLDERSKFHEAGIEAILNKTTVMTPEDAFNKLRHAILFDALQEISTALKAVAGIE